VTFYIKRGKPPCTVFKKVKLFDCSNISIYIYWCACVWQGMPCMILMITVVWEQVPYTSSWHWQGRQLLTALLSLKQTSNHAPPPPLLQLCRPRPILYPSASLVTYWAISFLSFWWAEAAHGEVHTNRKMTQGALSIQAVSILPPPI
jgi:hypothetical protein